MNSTVRCTGGRKNPQQMRTQGASSPVPLIQKYTINKSSVCHHSPQIHSMFTIAVDKKTTDGQDIIIMDTNKVVVQVGFMKVFKFCGKSLHQHGQ